MGCITSKSTKNSIFNKNQMCSYSRIGKLDIKVRSKSTEVIGTQALTFHLSEPSQVTSKEVPLGQAKVQVSSCILPGLDPRGEYKKKCQDNCFYLYDDSSILCCLFDGHGRQGERVAEFCQTVIERLYETEKSLISENPLAFIKLATEKCDQELSTNTKGIDSELSGCTGVLIYIDYTSIYCGSVGDSRGLVVTTTVPMVLPAPPANLGSEREILAGVKQKRQSFIDHSINSIQLTRDQKPEDPEELQRISKAGGRVQRLIDKAGNNIGPYRVWEQNSNAPGLAMSRSIGDLVAKKLGVISEPVCTSYTRNSGDLFIVIASDGLWDAMDNDDVGTFVECYRGKCKTNSNSPFYGNLINPENASIAQILCEEARMRWFTIVEEEDVVIDDISCIVLELSKAEEIEGRAVKHIKRPAPMDNTVDNVESGGNELKRAPTLKEVMVKDPRRGSVVTDIVED